jgi:hypothetical protein
LIDKDPQPQNMSLWSVRCGALFHCFPINLGPSLRFDAEELVACLVEELSRVTYFRFDAITRGDRITLENETDAQTTNNSGAYTR